MTPMHRYTPPAPHPGGRPRLPDARRSRLDVRVGEGDLDALDELARAWRLTRSETVRRAVGEALERIKRKTR
jgi:hypothetical protein